MADFKVEATSYTWTYNGEQFEVNGAVILLPDALKGDGIIMDAVVYAEDEDGNLLDFSTVEEAQEWIDKYKDNLSWHIEHGDEIHATPTIKR